MRSSVFALFLVLSAAAAGCGVPGPGFGEDRDSGGFLNNPDAVSDVVESDARDPDATSNPDTPVGTDSGRDTGGSDADSDSGGPGPICGNGVVETGEACDDGNNFPNDGCSPLCDSTEECGNRIIDPGESCDDGNFLVGDGCDGFCRLEEGCGNGTVDVGEQCDDGNIADGDGCSRECARELALLTDSDNDTISDFDEGNGRIDTDGDGITDDEDLDSDGDGVSDAIEAGDSDIASEAVDTDLDGIPDFRDLDADGDGIPDADEGAADFDLDGLGNYADTDSDGDYVPDSVEGNTDSNGDGWPNYLDVDSDGDSILDSHELFADSDYDGQPNRVDLDSDNDGRLDSAEAGDANPETYPVDTDSDGQPDYVDRDSDDDGLPDTDETGCPWGTDPTNPDTDGDSYPDLAEVLVGSPPCSHTSAAQFREYTDFFFILPERSDGEEAPLEFSSEIVRADVHMNIDASGSMDGEIANLRSRMSSFVVPRVNGAIDDVAFGVSDFRDCRDFAWRLHQRITTDVSRVQSALNGMRASNGSNEPTYSTLRHIGDGNSTSCMDIPNFNPSANRVPGVADGTIGGVGFRNDAFPIVIHATDEFPQDGNCGGCAANQSQAAASLNSIGARMIGVVSNSDPRGTLRSIASSTGAVVPACAWDGARPSGCGSGQCCTGVNGAGEGTSGGMCPLVFNINSNGNGLSDSIVTGIVALVNTTSFDVTTRLRRDPDEFIRTGVDTSCFIRSIIPSHSDSSGSCVTAPVPADLSPVDGVNDSFRNVTPGTQLFFDVRAENNGCVEATDSPQAYFAYIDVIGDGITTLDTQSVTIIVPPSNDPVSTVP